MPLREERKREIEDRREDHIQSMFTLIMQNFDVDVHMPPSFQELLHTLPSSKSASLPPHTDCSISSCISLMNISNKYIDEHIHIPSVTF